MNDKLQNAGAEAIKQLMEWLKQGGEFVAAQAPDLARQVLAYDLTVASICSVLSAIVCACCAWIAVVCIRKINQSSDIEEGWTLGAVVCVFFGAGSFIAMLRYLFVVLKINIAPKLYLIERMAELLK